MWPLQTIHELEKYTVKVFINNFVDFSLVLCFAKTRFIVVTLIKHNLNPQVLNLR